MDFKNSNLIPRLTGHLTRLVTSLGSARLLAPHPLLHDHLQAAGGGAAVHLVPLHPELLDGGPEAEDAALYPALLPHRGLPPGLGPGEGGALHRGHEPGEADVPGVPDQLPARAVHQRLLYDRHPPGREEVLAPAGEGVGLHDEPPGVERVALHPGVQRVHGEDVLAVRVGVAAPVGRRHLAPRQRYPLLGLPVPHLAPQPRILTSHAITEP